MRNTSSASDSRSGKDASVYNENGVMVAYIETFKSTVNFANSKYKVLGDMQEHATPGSYTVTLSFSAITIMSEEFFTDVMAAMEIGESPRVLWVAAMAMRSASCTVTFCLMAISTSRTTPWAIPSSGSLTASSTSPRSWQACWPRKAA